LSSANILKLATCRYLATDSFTLRYCSSCLLTNDIW